STFEKLLNMNGTEIGRDLFMSGKATFTEVDLTGARISGSLDMGGSTFNDLLTINGTEIGQHLFMCA
ncbi:MAG: hypothetical protein GWN13_12800, partial [Phycisphaerae bacterium]|nr:hypothetical protein [Phycisphaerae bacterium]